LGGPGGGEVAGGGEDGGGDGALGVDEGATFGGGVAGGERGADDVGSVMEASSAVMSAWEMPSSPTVRGQMTLL
jgi:hypothetical protein